MRIFILFEGFGVNIFFIRSIPSVPNLCNLFVGTIVGTITVTGTVSFVIVGTITVTGSSIVSLVSENSDPTGYFSFIFFIKLYLYIPDMPGHFFSVIPPIVLTISIKTSSSVIPSTTYFPIAISPRIIPIAQISISGP